MMDSQNRKSKLEELQKLFDQLSPEDKAWAIILALFADRLPKENPDDSAPES